MTVGPREYWKEGGRLGGRVGEGDSHRALVLISPDLEPHLHAPERTPIYPARLPSLPSNPTRAPVRSLSGSSLASI